MTTATAAKPSIPGVGRYATDKAYGPLVEWCASKLPRLSFERAREAYAALLADHGKDPKAIAIAGLVARALSHSGRSQGDFPLVMAAISLLTSSLK